VKRIVHVASEIAPFAQSGGLADVLAGLPAALAELGFEVAVVVPMYRGIAQKLAATDAPIPIAIQVGPHRFEAAIVPSRVGRVTCGFLDCPVLYDRSGTLYGPGGAAEFGDNHLRFSVLGKAAVEHGHHLVGGPIDVLHVHDWQGAPAAVYAYLTGHATKRVVTIHNLAYRGIFPKWVMTDLGFPWSLFTLHQLEFYDQVSLLKGALALADVVTTVSPSYADEILTPQFGETLDGFLLSDVERLVGIVNGIEVAEWDPAIDPALPAHFTVDDLSGKARCRAELARELGFQLDDNEALVGAVARMTGQKGLDLIADAASELHRLGAKLVVLGSGEPALEARFAWLATALSHHVVVRIGFDVALAHRIYAGCDLFAMPSRFEPCGLGQLYAMRYGTIPVVHTVGGLRDTVADPETGICFAPATAPALVTALDRGVRLFRDPIARDAVRREAMSRDWSWTASAKRYVELYESL
jgi:starch synthase